MKNLVVGAGLSGAILANLIASELNEDVLVIDRRDVIAGNVFDYEDEETGIIVHKYGPHIFHTNNKRVWEFLSKYTDWYEYKFMPLAFINEKFVNIPFNLNTIHQIFSPAAAERLEERLINEYSYGSNLTLYDLMKNKDKDIKFVARYVYKYLFKNYTLKQWNIAPEDIDKSVISRVPIRISNDNRYFTDKYQGIPLNGYTKMVENILKHPKISVKLNTEYKSVSGYFDRIFYTGSIDEYFDYKYGELPYRSLSFDVQKLNIEYYQKVSMVNYPNNNDFTRIVEHKHFLDTKSEKTIITFEYPQKFELNKNERFYPIKNIENEAIYNKYIDESHQTEGLFFIGRLGAYKYFNMDQVIEEVMKFFDLNLSKGTV